MASCNSSLKHKIFPVDEETYGKENYQTHALEIYKLYVEKAEITNGLRRGIHPLFVSIHLLLIGVISYTIENNLSISIGILYVMPGITLSIVWRRLILNYERSFSIKLKVIREMEKKLPLAPYIGEREIAESLHPGDNSPRYVEDFVPWAEKLIPLTFIGLHVFGIVYVLELLK